MMTPRYASLIERFGHCVRVGDDCWEWVGYVNSNGYGTFGAATYAHRAMYEWWYGAIPSGKQIDHLCRNRKCVRPTHLEAVTQDVNLLRGASPIAEHARKTHCKRGHPFDEANTFYPKRKPRTFGGRDRGCLTCKRMREHQYYLKRRRGNESNSAV